MKKTIVSLTERQMEALTSQAKDLGISKSELLRRILDKYLGTGKKLPIPSKIEDRSKQDNV